MRIAAISDLHIGPFAHASVFGHQVPAFASFLDELEANHDRIVLLGDVYQADWGTLPTSGSARRHLDRVRKRVEPLTRRFDAQPYDYVHGNHDIIAATALDAPESLTIEADGFRVFFIHGHQADPLLQNAYAVARTATWVSGQLRLAGLGAPADWLEGKDIAIKQRRFGGKRGPYIGAAKQWLTEHEADVVVMGHTHVAGRVDLSEGTVVNTGSCSRGVFEFVSIDTAERSVAVHDAVTSTLNS